MNIKEQAQEEATRTIKDGGTRKNERLGFRLETITRIERTAFVKGAEFGYNQRWIPVTERLPKEEDGDKHGEVLWMYEDHQVDAAKWDDPYTGFIAWMPIPKYEVK